MGRAQVSNDKYTFAFGVDHTPMGCFIQVWEKAAKGENPEMDAMDAPQIDADEMFGIRVHNKTLDRNPNLFDVVVLLQLEVNSLREQHIVTAIGEALGFDVAKQDHELWD